MKRRKIFGFCDYVKRRMLKFHDQKLAIKKFKLKMYSLGLCQISKDVDIWLKLACECGVQVRVFPMGWTFPIPLLCLAKVCH
jgi:hypothetical protein